MISRSLTRLVGLAAVAAFALVGATAHAQTMTFSTPGFFNYFVGTGVTSLNVTLAGAGADGNGVTGRNGGNGGLVTARLTGVTAGQVLRIVIGAAGDIAAVNGSGGTVPVTGSGGELSAIALGSGTDLSALSYLLIAGGGGGATNSDNGVNGGGLIGASGAGVNGGGGGTQTAGGAAGVGDGSPQAGSALKGGNGGNTGVVLGGGGGGGYFGGGGGAIQGGFAGAGGGGSSFSSASVLGGITVSNVVHTQGGGGIGGRYNPNIDGQDPAVSGSLSITAVSVVPEASSVWLALAGIAPVAMIARRKRSAA